VCGWGAKGVCKKSCVRLNQIAHVAKEFKKMKANRNYVLGFAAAAAITAAAMPAYAADAVFEQPPAPPAAPIVAAPVATWEGPYAGVALGYGFSGRTEVNPSGGPTNRISTDGFVGNVFGGWQGQSGQFVYGVEGDVGYNGMKGDNAGVETKGGVDGSLRARVGVAATDDILIYGTAGGAAGRHKVEVGPNSDSNTHLGWTAGAGVDVKLTEQSFARLEYRYTDLGDKTYNIGGTDYEVDARSNKVMLGFGMSF
jgi:outer membrane immunogenic protein